MEKEKAEKWIAGLDVPLSDQSEASFEEYEARQWSQLQ